MAALPAPDTPFDMIRADGSAHIIGVARALALWRPLLRPGGTLVLSDMVWHSATPDPELLAFWARGYPDMADVATRLSQARAAGYRVRGRIDPGPAALDAYYTPLAARVAAMAGRLSGTQVLADLTAELDCWRNARGQFGYAYFVLQRPCTCRERPSCHGRPH